MSTHTPGPWAQGNNDPFSFGRKQGNGTEPIGFVDGPAFAERSEYGQTALANARLIAAAPDLLFQLLAAANYIDALGGDSKSYRGAIAKATGATVQRLPADDTEGGE